jgi:dihydroflavonol-4-reductase
LWHITRDLGKQQAVADAVAGHAAAPDARLEFARADLTDDAGWDAALSGVSYVLHVATRSPPPPAIRTR